MELPNFKTLIDMDSEEARAAIRASKQKKYNFMHPYLMDYWFPLLEHLSFPAELIEMPKSFVGVFDNQDSDEVKELVKLLNTKIHKKTFIKTSARSPKDWSYPDVPSASNGEEVINVLGASMRILDDTVDNLDIAPFYIVLRPFIDIPAKYEFRCFVKNRKLIGVSQYFYDRVFEGLADEKEYLENEIRQFHIRINESYSIDDYVFDVFFNSDKMPVLIEINPYGLSDPCLFRSYENLEKNGGFKITEVEDHENK